MIRPGIVDTQEKTQDKLYAMSRGWKEESLEAGDWWFEVHGLVVGIETKSGVDLVQSWLDKQDGIHRLEEQCYRLRDCCDIPILLYGDYFCGEIDGMIYVGYPYQVPHTRIVDTLLTLEDGGITVLPYNEAANVGRAHAVLALQRHYEKDIVRTIRPASKYLIDHYLNMLACIPTINMKLAKAIKERCPTMGLLSACSTRGLMEIPGVGETRAQQIWNALHGK